MTQTLPARRLAYLGVRSEAAAGQSRVRPARSQAGFTLLELLVVLAVIIIATALIIPNLNTIDTSAFNAEVRRAASALTYARRLAIVEGSARVASFHALNPQSPDYRDQQEALLAAKAVAKWNSDKLSLRFQYERSQPSEAVDSVDVTFFPQGGSTGGVLSFVQDERRAMIRIDPITGRIATAYNGEDFDDAY